MITKLMMLMSFICSGLLLITAVESREDDLIWAAIIVSLVLFGAALWGKI